MYFPFFRRSFLGGIAVSMASGDQFGSCDQSSLFTIASITRKTCSQLIVQYTRDKCLTPFSYAHQNQVKETRLPYVRLRQLQIELQPPQTVTNFIKTMFNL